MEHLIQAPGSSKYCHKLTIFDQSHALPALDQNEFSCQSGTVGRRTLFSYTHEQHCSEA